MPDLANDWYFRWYLSMSYGAHKSRLVEWGLWTLVAVAGWLGLHLRSDPGVLARPSSWKRGSCVGFFKAIIYFTKYLRFSYFRVSCQCPAQSKKHGIFVFTEHHRKPLSWGRSGRRKQELKAGLELFTFLPTLFLFFQHAERSMAYWLGYIRAEHRERTRLKLWGPQIHELWKAYCFGIAFPPLRKSDLPKGAATKSGI